MADKVFDPEQVERVTVPPSPRKGVHGQMIMPEDCYRDMVYAADYDALLALYREACARRVALGIDSKAAE